MKKSVKIIIIIVAILLVLGIISSTVLILILGKNTNGGDGSGGINSSNEQNTVSKLFDESGNDKNKIHVGDYIAYNEGEGNTYISNEKELFKTDGTLKWRVLGVEDGKIKLIADDTISLKNTIKFGENYEEVNKMCEIFGKGEGAESARNIQFSEIQKFADFSKTTLDKDNKYLLPCYYLDDNSTEYNMLFKNEDGFYKKYVINDENYNCFGLLGSDCPIYSIGEKSSNYGKDFLPVVILKQDVNITRKNDDGVWEISNSNKKYKELEYIEISSAEDFVKLTKENADLNANYKLTNDIDLSKIKNFTQIGGKNGYGDEFKGVFDGNNHTITGVNIENTKYDTSGIFGKTDGAIIKNLNVKDAKVTTKCTDDDYNYVGILVGEMDNTKIINCNVSGTILSKDADETNCYGILVGNVVEGEIYNCNVSGNIVSNFTCSTGGLTGRTCSTTYIEKCNVNTNLGTNEGFDIAGFIGQCKASTIIKCGITGNIQFNGNKYSVGHYASGFINSSDVGTNNEESFIIQCYSKANVTCPKTEGYMSGFIGETQNDYVFDCYYKGNLKIGSTKGAVCSFKSIFHDDEEHINNCYTDANIQGGRKINDYIEIEGNFYYNNEVTSEFSSKNKYSVGLTSKEFEDKDSFKELDFDNVWKWDDKTKRPVLKWE